MKITTKQIQQIIKEELDKVLYEQDTEDKLIKAIHIAITRAKRPIEHYDDKFYFNKIKQFIKKHYKKIQDPKVLQEFEEKVLPNLDNIDLLPSFFGQFRSFVYFDEESYEEKEALEIEAFLDGDELAKEKAIIKREEILANHRLIYIKKQLPKKDLSRDTVGRLDFRYIDLEGVDLSGFNLSGQTFSKAKLKLADLSDAVCRSTYFNNSDLHQADLSNADLEGASFERAVITQANFSGALIGEDEDYVDTSFLNAVYDEGTHFDRKDDNVKKQMKKASDFDGSDQWRKENT